MDTTSPNQGGNVYIHAGSGAIDPDQPVQGPNGYIGFYVAPEGSQFDKERIRIDPDGGFYVDGRRVTEDIELYKAMRVFFLTATTSTPDDYEMALVDGVLTSVPKEG